MTRLARFIVCIAAIASVLASSGCGYALAGRGSFLPTTIRTIGIPTFANRTTVFNLETTLTQKVRAEFIGRGRYDIVPDATNVDAVLVGEVLAVTIAPASFNVANQLASRYAITMTAKVELRDVKANMVLWDNPGLVFRQEYDAAGNQQTDAAAFFGQDTQALDRMSTEFASSIVSAILEAF
jgi:hypothetical protein